VVAAIAAKVDRKGSEGTISYKGVTPVAVNPVIGRTVDQAKATAAIEARFPLACRRRRAGDLSGHDHQPKTSQAQIDAALTQAAQAVSGPLAHDLRARPPSMSPRPRSPPCSPGQPRPTALVTVAADATKVQATFVPLIGTPTAIKPQDAKIALVDGKPHITPSISSTSPDPTGLSALVPKALADPSRTLAVPVKTTDPAFTTADAQKLGIKQLVGTKDPLTTAPPPAPVLPPRGVHNLDLITGNRQQRDRPAGADLQPQRLRGRAHCCSRVRAGA